MAPRHWLVLSLLSIGYGLALSYGSLTLPAALGLSLLIIAGVCVQRARPRYVRVIGHGVFILTGLALAVSLMPGFNNAVVIDAIRFTPDAAPFTMDLNLDKPLIGFWLLLACPWILVSTGIAHSLKVGALAMVVTSAFCMTAAVLMGITGWTPKWPAQSTIWWVNNLLLVTLTEELFFRAYLQGGLQRWFGSARFASPLAIVITACLFGLSHLGAGWEWVLLAGMAGIGYGMAWRFGGLSAAVISHFGLNLVHFGLFTYPMLDR
ncbi:CAAX protease family protein [Pseudomonas floridensis]|uniref:CAAX protease family protein n=1 Tax=Pseudomonas floridensis TaxID=1958950 RepID=A0A1X0N9I7_9PSED|nr:CPBP family intramembrane glutamic endopeptidase [Pseudomonas floridensis]ORC60658.1 CAAX protease family protein [Pseudomonas floridensis]